MSVLATAPDPVTVGTDLVTSTGGTLVTTLTGVLPAVIGIGAAFWAVRFVLGKLGMRGKVAQA